MKRMLGVVLAGCLLAGAVMAQTEMRIKVAGQRVNLRAKPDPQSEVVVQIADDVSLLARSFQEEWVEVSVPDSADLWVHRDLIKDNVVTGSKVYVRAGAGINYKDVGLLRKGDTIVPRGEFGEWIKIAPPSSCSLWVSRKLVTVMQPEKTVPGVALPGQALPPPAVSADAPTTAPSPVTLPVAVKPAGTFPAAPVTPSAVSPMIVTVSSNTPASAVAPPPDLPLIPLEGQGRMVQRSGVLKMSGFLVSRPSRFRLVKTEGRNVDTVCYVLGNQGQLNSLLDQELLIRGREYWVRGAKLPVVIPEQIIPRAEP